MASVTVRCLLWQPQQYQKLARAVNDLPTHMLRRNYALRKRRQISGSHCGGKSCVCHTLTICLPNFQHAFLCLVEITFEISGSHSGRRVWKKNVLWNFQFLMRSCTTVLCLHSADHLTCFFSMRVRVITLSLGLTINIPAKDWRICFIGRPCGVHALRYIEFVLLVSMNVLLLMLASQEWVLEMQC